MCDYLFLLGMYDPSFEIRDKTRFLKAVLNSDVNFVFLNLLIFRMN